MVGADLKNLVNEAPSADRYGYSETYLRGRITGALGGRAAEEIVYGDVTTGAEYDMEHASSIVRQMVGRWGMSAAIGPVSVLPASGQESPCGADGVSPGPAPAMTTRNQAPVPPQPPAHRPQPPRPTRLT
jgi:ATP-dependent Zn protease